MDACRFIGEPSHDNDVSAVPLLSFRNCKANILNLTIRDAGIGIAATDSSQILSSFSDVSSLDLIDWNKLLCNFVGLRLLQCILD
jgi:hypothetical protein